MTMLSSLDILFLALSVSSIIIAIPLCLVLWRVYKMMDRIENILQFGEKMVHFADKLQSLPMQIVENLITKLK